VITLLLHLLRLLPFLVGGHRQLALENLALRQQLAIYKRTLARPQLRTTDRLFWAGLARIWTGWRQALVIVAPDTVLRWQRRRFREYWARLSRRPTGGRPPLDAEIAALIRKMAAATATAFMGSHFRHRVKGMGIEELLTAPQSPWQNPFVERLIGSIRRECSNHVLVLGERHLRRILTRYLVYYHQARTHLALDKDAPDVRPIALPSIGKIVQLPEVGGLHHRYVRQAT
jgi:transposase InsO family protein